jgi:LPS export ABC transporter protein LptC
VRSWCLLAAAALSGACGHSKHPAGEEPVQKLEDFSMSQTTLGSPAWELHARSAILTEGDTKAQLQSPDLVFFKNHRKVSTLVAKAGFVRTDTYDVTLTSAVVVHSLDDDSTLMTEELRYSSQRKLFVTDKDVLVKRPGGVLRGTGLEATPDLSDIRVFKQQTRLKELPR